MSIKQYLFHFYSIIILFYIFILFHVLIHSFSFLFSLYYFVELDVTVDENNERDDEIDKLGNVTGKVIDDVIEEVHYDTTAEKEVEENIQSQVDEDIEEFQEIEENVEEIEGVEVATMYAEEHVEDKTILYGDVEMKKGDQAQEQMDVSNEARAEDKAVDKVQDVVAGGVVEDEPVHEKEDNDGARCEENQKMAKEDNDVAKGLNVEESPFDDQVLRDQQSTLQTLRIPPLLSLPSSLLLSSPLSTPLPLLSFTLLI